MGKRKSSKRTLTLWNKLGLHARPAALLARTASRFRAHISIECQGRKVDARSIIGLLTLGAPNGASLIVHAEGEDASEALDAIERLVAEKFGEE